MVQKPSAANEAKAEYGIGSVYSLVAFSLMYAVSFAYRTAMSGLDT